MNWFNNSLLPSVKRKWVTEGKRCQALTLLYRTIPDVLDRTPVTAIFAPDAGGLYTQPADAEVIIYLAPELEIESQEQVNFTVAHEFAHVVLSHSFLCWDAKQGQSEEQAADALARKWGFERQNQPYMVNKEMLTVYRLLASRQNYGQGDGLSPASSASVPLLLFVPRLDASTPDTFSVLLPVPRSFETSRLTTHLLPFNNNSISPPIAIAPRMFCWFFFRRELFSTVSLSVYIAC